MSEQQNQQNGGGDGQQQPPPQKTRSGSFTATIQALSALPQTDAVKETAINMAIEASESARLQRTQYLADQAYASGMFPLKNAAQAEMLMHIARARQIPEVEALLQFHLIPGPGGAMKPSMTSQAMQASFQKSGGLIVWERTDDEAAIATFSHPVQQPTPLKLSTTWEQYKNKNFTKTKEGGVKDNWRDSRDDMLAARLVSKGVRRIHPGLVNGIYTPEEIADMAEEAKELRGTTGSSPDLATTTPRDQQRARIKQKAEPDATEQSDFSPLADLEADLQNADARPWVEKIAAKALAEHDESLHGEINAMVAARIKSLSP